MRRSRLIALITILLVTLNSPLLATSAEGPKVYESTLIPAEVVKAEHKRNIEKAKDYEEYSSIEMSKAAVLVEPEEPAGHVDLDHYYIPWADVTISLEEFKLLCRTVYCESGNQSLEAQRLCAVVIINRIVSDRFPNTLKEVVYQGGGSQFNVVRRSDFEYVNYHQGKDLTETACFLAIATCSEEPGSLLYFRSGHYHTGSSYENYCSDGAMYYSLQKE